MTSVIMVALDGLRPDMVDPVATPHLHALGMAGARFLRTRSVFPSETRVATPSLITGCRPGGHGLVANTLFDASVAPDRLIRTKLVEDVLTLAAGAESPLQRASLAERLAPHGMSLPWSAPARRERRGCFTRRQSGLAPFVGMSRILRARQRSALLKHWVRLHLLPCRISRGLNLRGAFCLNTCCPKSNRMWRCFGCQSPMFPSIGADCGLNIRNARLNRRMQCSGKS